MKKLLFLLLVLLVSCTSLRNGEGIDIANEEKQTVTGEKTDHSKAEDVFATLEERVSILATEEENENKIQESKKEKQESLATEIGVSFSKEDSLFRLVKTESIKELENLMAKEEELTEEDFRVKVFYTMEKECFQYLLIPKYTNIKVKMYDLVEENGEFVHNGEPVYSYITGKNDLILLKIGENNPPKYSLVIENEDQEYEWIPSPTFEKTEEIEGFEW